LARKQKKPEVASEAAFLLLRLDTQVRERKAHVGALLSFAGKHADSARAVEALEGLVTLSADAQPRAKEIRKVGAKVRDTLIAANNTGSLRRVGSVLRKFGDEEGAKRADDAATPPNGSAPPPGGGGFFGMGGPRDPLGPKNTGAFVIPPDMAKKVAAQTAAARLVADDCRSLPHENAHLLVRVYVDKGAVTKAIVLDPEVSPELKACLEKGARGLKELPPTFGPKIELNVPLDAKPMAKRDATH
jgi:hypothetical protein